MSREVWFVVGWILWGLLTVLVFIAAGCSSASPC